MSLALLPILTSSCGNWIEGVSLLKCHSYAVAYEFPKIMHKQMWAKVWEYAWQDLPVWYVCAANHGGQVDNRVASHTSLVEFWVLSDQMTGQETPVRASTNCHFLHVEVVTFQHTFNCKLVATKAENKCKTFQRHMDQAKIKVGGEKKAKGGKTELVLWALNRMYRKH